MIIRVQDKSEKLGVRAWVYTWPGGSVLESSASFQRIENELNVCHAPLLARFFFSVILMATKHLPRPQHHFYGLKIKPNVC